MTSDLQGQASRFAQELTDILNGTITQHVRMRAVLRPRSSAGAVFTVGHGLTKTNVTQPQAFPLSINLRKPRAWMNLSFQVRMDSEDRYLTVHSSYCGIFTDPELKTCLCHWDYERGKDRYPSAHVQVYGTSPALEALNEGDDRKRPLEKLHIPVGGKRFRPCIEDAIEFLVTERLAEGREDWQKRLDESRNHYRRRQLLAAMRRNPDVVEEYLREREREQDGQ
ncbi:hypothetical protein [Streptomyces sp. NBC_01261]|uniref:hypothetical protein n=1 Tax=unclassified Streptomyces TaxID=2593676 RepID=UPI002E34D7A7|nr:hypothetical protein [Streptomyces sp. NBC_01261]